MLLRMLDSKQKYVRHINATETTSTGKGIFLTLEAKERSKDL